VTNSTNDVPATKSAGTRKVIQATCIKHGRARGFTNVVLTKRGGEIEPDPHATGACVLRLDENAATAVRDTITEWLG
jgi:hypothetical protein